MNVTEEDDSDDESVIIDFQFAMGTSGLYDDKTILIDTGSTFSVMKNPKMVVDIRKSKKVMKVETNSGVHETNHKAFLPVFFEVWFNTESKFNILSWADVRKSSGSNQTQIWTIVSTCIYLKPE